MQENRFDLRRRDEPAAGWVYIGSFRTKEAAEAVVESLKDGNPHLATEFWIQAGGGQEQPLWFDKEPEKPRVATKGGGGKKKSNDEPFSE